MKAETLLLEGTNQQTVDHKTSKEAGRHLKEVIEEENQEGKGQLKTNRRASSAASV